MFKLVKNQIEENRLPFYLTTIVTMICLKFLSFQRDQSFRLHPIEVTYGSAGFSLISTKEGKHMPPPFDEPRHSPNRRQTIVFVGSTFSFSDAMLRFLTLDFPGLTVKRCSTLQEVAILSATAEESILAIVLDQAYAVDIEEHVVHARHLAPEAQIAIAYKSFDCAVEVFMKMAAQVPPVDVALLPIRTHYDAWRSAISLVLNGEGYIPNDVIKAGLLQLTPAALAAVPAVVQTSCAGSEVQLTDRELEVLAQVSKGLQNKHVAEELGLSEHTVKLHVHHIISKLRVHNRTEATVWYLAAHRDVANEANDKAD